MAVIQIRSVIGANKEVRDTLKMLNLGKVNRCTIIHENPSYMGMLQKVKDYVTWGEISEEMLKILIEKRGRLKGNKRIGEEFLRSHSKILERRSSLLVFGTIFK